MKCRFKVGDPVKSGDIRGFVKNISEVKTNTVGYVCVVDVYLIKRPIYVFGFDWSDVSELSFIESDLSFDRDERINQILNNEKAN